MHRAEQALDGAAVRADVDVPQLQVLPLRTAAYEYPLALQTTLHMPGVSVSHVISAADMVMSVDA